MTFVTVDRHADGQLILRSDMLVTVGPCGPDFAMPKLLIPDRDVVVGVAGDNPQAAIGNIVEVWPELGSPEMLRDWIHDDTFIEQGFAHRREYLMAVRSGELFRWKDGGWSELSFGRTTIGSQEARESYQAPTFTVSAFEELDSREAESLRERLREYGRSMEWGDDHEIEEQIRFMEGGDDDPLSREIASGNASTNAAGVGGPMPEVHLTDRGFRFVQQTQHRVLGGGYPVTSRAIAAQVLTGELPPMLVEYEFSTVGDAYPACLRFDFTATGAAVSFHPSNSGYEAMWHPPDDH